MIHHLDLSLELPYRICRSISKSRSKASWAIVLPDKISIVINPNSELLEFCQKDKVIQIDSQNLKDAPKNVQISSVNIRTGSYLQNFYIVLDGQILFPCNVPQCSWGKLMKTLKAKILLANTGEIFNQAEVNLISLVC